MEGNDKIIKEDFPSIVPLDSRFIFVIGTSINPNQERDLIINLRLIDSNLNFRKITFAYPFHVKLENINSDVNKQNRIPLSIEPAYSIFDHRMIFMAGGQCG